MLALCLGASIFLLFIGLLFVPMSNAMPLAATCSAAISANCHREEGDTDAQFLPLQWGVVSEISGQVSHCSFSTAKDIRSPTEDGLYR